MPPSTSPIEPTTKWKPRRGWTVAVALTLAWCGGSCRTLESGPQTAFAPGASLSEDEGVAEELRESLTAFLDGLRAGEWSASHTDSMELERFGFFHQSVARGARDAEPVVLKSYPMGGGNHRITVAFVGGVPDAQRIHRVVEFEAIPAGHGYLFQSPYDRNTEHFQRRTIGDVTFRFRGALDVDRATEFAAFKARFDSLLGKESEPLQYDCFQGLESLLRAFGLVHDGSKCNFLLHDLGFVWHAGERYATGTGNADYRFGYVNGVLSRMATDELPAYRPYVTGVAAYYGGYSLSGDTMEVLARQFREELKKRPAMDFLEEFEKGRGSSIQRHFSNYVMCAFLFQEIAARHGEAVALRPVLSGANGERFFDDLETLIGVTRDNFHTTIVRLIGAQV